MSAPAHLNIYQFSSFFSLSIQISYFRKQQAFYSKLLIFAVGDLNMNNLAFSAGLLE